MGKRQVFTKISKWMIVFLLLAAFFTAGKQEKEKSNFFQIGKEVFQHSVIKQMLYSQSMILGMTAEQELTGWSRKAVIRTDGFLLYEKQENIIMAEQELELGLQKENEVAVQETKEEVVLEEPEEFIPIQNKQKEINMEEYKNIEALVKAFYTVDATTSVDETFFYVETLDSYDCTLDTKVEGPQILLYHTHSQETFVDSEPGKEADTIVGAGEILAKLLESYGYKVYHHKGKYDVESRDYAYSNSLSDIETILKENPGIQVVIDLHRDAVAEDTKLVTQVQGRQMAKVMFFNGLGRSKEKGEISYLKNPYLQENLAFSFQMKVACDEYYPGFARNIYLRAYRYNMHLCPKTLLIELGAQTNTKEEIHNALEPLAHVLDIVISGKNKK